MAEDINPYEILRRVPGWFLLLLCFFLFLIAFKDSFFAVSFKEFSQLVHINYIMFGILVLALYYYRRDSPQINFTFGDKKTYKIEDRETSGKNVKFTLTLPFEVSNSSKREGYIYAMNFDVNLDTPVEKIMENCKSFGIHHRGIYISNSPVQSSISTEPICIGTKVLNGKICIDFSITGAVNPNIGYIMMRLIKKIEIILKYNISSNGKIKTFTKKLVIHTGRAWFTK